MSAVLAELQSKAEARVSLLAQRLSKIIDPAQISATAKIPYKVITYREALIWRTEELARAACDLSTLIASLLLFDHAYDGITKEMPAFISVCEQAIHARPK